MQKGAQARLLKTAQQTPEANMRRPWLTLGLLSLFGSVAEAQTRLAGAGQCAKPDLAHKIAVPDRPNHVFSISQVKCTWSKPVEIAGVRSSGGTAVQFDEVTGNSSRYHGHYLDTMANGDTAHYRYEGTATLKDGMPQRSTWNWTLEGGTGKLKGVNGKGTCKGTASPDGSTWECQGEYRLPR